MISRSEPSELRQFLDEYAIDRGLETGSLRALVYVINSFERHLARPARLADLNRQAVNAWLAGLLAQKLDPETVRGRRTAILGIWKHAVESSMLDLGPARIRKIKVADKPPTCWDLPELRKLLKVARDLDGVMNKDRRIDRADFWQAYIYTDYGTGLRLGDLRKLRFDNIAPDGTTIVVQSKTGELHVGYIEAKGMRLLAKLRTPGRQLVFGDLVNHSNAQRYFRKLVKLAGLRGSTKWIRRTGATWSEVKQAGSAQRYCGHKTPGVVWKSYLDRRFLQSRKPKPPRLG